MTEVDHMESVSQIGRGDLGLPNHAALFVHEPRDQQSGPEAAAWGSLCIKGVHTTTKQGATDYFAFLPFITQCFLTLILLDEDK